MLIVWIFAIVISIYTFLVAKNILTEERNKVGALIVMVLAISILLSPVAISYFR